MKLTYCDICQKQLDYINDRNAFQELYEENKSLIYYLRHMGYKHVHPDCFLNIDEHLKSYIPDFIKTTILNSQNAIATGCKGVD